MHIFASTVFRMGSSLAVQWLRLGSFTAVALDSIPGRGTKIPQATSAAKKKIFFLGWLAWDCHTIFIIIIVLVTLNYKFEWYWNSRYLLFSIVFVSVNAKPYSTFMQIRKQHPLLWAGETNMPESTV